MVDFIVLIFAGAVGLLLVGSIALVFILAFTSDRSLSEAAGAITDITNTLIGALIGFIGGRSQGRYEEAKSNGNGTPPEPGS